MGKPYSVDLRERVVAAVEEGGLSRRQAAVRFGVSYSAAIAWVKRYRETGSVGPGQMGGHKPKAIRDQHHAWLMARCRERDFTLRGLVAELAARGRVEAPWLLDGPINGERFQLYVEQVLAPSLTPGDIVIMDNLGSHKGKPVRRTIRNAGAKLIFLPKYSPDLNPVEKLFAKLNGSL